MKLVEFIIERVDFYEKDTKGNELRTKNGDRYYKARIITAKGKTIYVNVFSKEQKDLLKIGQEVELEETQNGQYTYYSFLKKKTGAWDKVMELEKRIKILEDYIFGRQEQDEPEIGGHINDVGENMPF